MCLLGTGDEKLHWKVLEGTFLTNTRCVHGMKLSGCGIRDSLTLLFSKKGVCMHVCVCV